MTSEIGPLRGNVPLLFTTAFAILSVNEEETSVSYIQHKSEESIEDYLETILILSKRLPAVRSIDIAAALSYSKPSVSVAMKNLRYRDLILVNEDGGILLTEEGRRIAESTYERHTLLTDWLISLGVSPQIAAADACKMEHDMTPESFDAIKRFILCHQ